MKQPAWPLFGIGALCLLVVGLAIITFGGKFGWLKEASLQQSERADTALEEDHAQPDDGRIEIGGVRRPASDLQPQWGDRQPSGTPGEPLIQNAGVSPLLSPDTNEATEYVSQFVRDTARPEVSSVFFKPKPFDRDQFLANPREYLGRVEPGRIFQVSENEQAAHIKRDGDFHRRLVQGESTVLRAVAEPNMPVSFYSAQLGQFDNNLSTITVQANGDGIAEATFTASPGTIGNIEVLAASPTSRGQARFVVRVELPGQTVNLGSGLRP